jgi:hypothetical protein
MTTAGRDERMDVIYLDPCLYIPTGSTPQERAESKTRIIAGMQDWADQLNERGGPYRMVVGIPPWMGPTEHWLDWPPEMIRT